jgi:hypothetical protein
VIGHRLNTSVIEDEKCDMQLELHGKTVCVLLDYAFAHRMCVCCQF